MARDRRAYRELREELSELEEALAHGADRVSDEAATSSSQRSTSPATRAPTRGFGPQRTFSGIPSSRNTLRERGVELGTDEVSLETLDALWEEAAPVTEPADQRQDVRRSMLRSAADDRDDARKPRARFSSRAGPSALPGDRAASDAFGLATIEPLSSS